jgi:putative DNA primase/helicase
MSRTSTARDQSSTNPDEIESRVGKLTPFPLLDLPSGAIQLPSGKTWDSKPLTEKELKYEKTQIITRLILKDKGAGYRPMTPEEWKKISAQAKPLPAPAATRNGKLSAPPQSGVAKGQKRPTRSKMEEEVPDLGPASWYRKLRIPAELLMEAQVHHISDQQARKYGLRSPADQKLDGIMFRYFNRDGEFVLYCRVRLDEEYVDEEGKKHKYHGRGGGRDKRTLYYPPNPAERLKTKPTIVLVEAEKSVLALEAVVRRTGRTDILPLGMGGKDGWHWRDAKDRSNVLPDLDVLNGERVVIMLDSNWATNSDVRNSRDNLALELSSRRAEVLVADLPQEKGVNGPDDYCGLHTDEEVLKLIDSAHVANIAPYSEQALALRFVAEHRDNVMYVIGVGYHVWDEVRWKNDEELKVDELAHQLCKKAAEECGKASLADKVRSRRMRESILREAQTYLIRSPEMLDRDKHLLNTPAGVVDLKTGKLRPAKREDFITMVTAVAPDFKSKPVRWLKFLDEVTCGNNKLAAYEQRVFGYCLTGETREHALFYLDGSGRNGKSMLAERVKESMGDYADTAPISMFIAQQFEEHSTGTAALRGKRMITASETRVGQFWDESKLKQYTGGDTLRARFMREDFISFTPNMKLVLWGNHRPRFRSIDDAIRDRFLAIPFRQHFAREDDKSRLKTGSKPRNTKLDLELRQELGAILAWAIRGAKAWYQSGLRTPSAVKETSEEYLVSQDSVYLWAKEKLQPIDKNDKKLKPATLMRMHTNYTEWCRNHKEFAVRRDEFQKQLGTLGYRSTKAQGSVTFPDYYLGIPKFQGSEGSSEE